MIFRQKINYNELCKLILKLGCERYKVLNNALKEEYVYNEFYFYILWQIINYIIFIRMLYFRKLISKEIDLFDNFLNIFFNNIIVDNKDDLSMSMIQINLELREIWKNDDDSNSNNELYNTANYLINELLDCDNKNYEYLKQFFIKYITDCHFENKNIIKNFKIIEKK